MFILFGLLKQLDVPFQITHTEVSPCRVIQWFGEATAGHKSIGLIRATLRLCVAPLSG